VTALIALLSVLAAACFAFSNVTALIALLSVLVAACFAFSVVTFVLWGLPKKPSPDVRRFLSPSQVCSKTHEQGCSYCENLICCDNTSPARGLLQAACEGLDDIPNAERREKLRKAIDECACAVPGRAEPSPQPSPARGEGGREDG